MGKIVFEFIDAGVGDCILISDVENDKKILVDAGPSKGEGRLSVSNTLQTLLNEQKKIDLAIVTHNDDDHIGGFKPLIEDKVIIVDEFLFNDVISCSTGLVDNQKISFNQDLQLKSIIDELGIKQQSVIVTEGSENSLTLGDMRLEFISPDLNKIRSLIAWAKKKNGGEELTYDTLKISSSSEHKTLEERISELLENDVFEADKSPTNGSSIAFILEYGDYRFLFLGDSHMDIIEEYLCSRKEIPNFEFIKLSHHSSEKNNSQLFFNNVSSEKYIICSDGYNNHGHPSLTTIARLSIASPDSIIHFTSDSEEIKIFTNSFSERCVYPTDSILKFEYELRK
ncbi:TPA: ComEC/Rec2 family competence protein [Vibrio diabolicus]